MTSNTRPYAHTDLSLSLSTRKWLMLIIAISVVLRIVGALYLGNQVFDMPGTHDQLSYDMVAKQILRGEGMTVPVDWWPATRAGEPTAHWSYLYVWLLAGIYALIGYNPIVPRILQAIATGVLVPWLVYRLGRRFMSSEAVGLTGAAVSAMYFYFVYYAGALMTETFYIVGILWTLDLAGELGQRDESKSSGFRTRYLLLGVALAVTIMLRQVFLLFVPFLFAWLLYRAYFHRAKSVPLMLGIMTAAVLILAAAIAPWTYRNYQVFDEFVLLNTNAGFAFYWGNHPVHGYQFQPLLTDGNYLDLIPEELRPLNEGQLDRALLKLGLGFIFDDPVRFVILAFTRVPEYFKFWPSSESGIVSNAARVGSFGIFLPLMLYGLWLGRRHLPMTSVLYLFVVIYAGVHIATWTLIRYRLPVDSVLIVFAGLAVIHLLPKRFFPQTITTTQESSLSTYG